MSAFLTVEYFLLSHPLFTIEKIIHFRRISEDNQRDLWLPLSSTMPILGGLFSLKIYGFHHIHLQNYLQWQLNSE